ncbi:FAD-dependent oxidoreductase [Jeotgalibaca sp. MA1X17-3]|uniref:dihydrolipoyl dehydrogenase family protein n=1 Tax=Jeotgalibaca sp. MA1X17-3 TaxID=2908211 RepID=UPI001F28438B|nr:FAD-dependent oxidoreductase [Jeotgalibaca sp. MA1X17-3]UJF16025.1 FAD-dependent oxidoreductase [Jeotgalibaca sp. MA1X17-3]
MKKYDVIIIGGGAGGLTVASGASSLGAKVALVEKEEHLGGDCLHVGCVPSKTLIQAAKEVHAAKNKTTQLGLQVSGEINMKEVKKRVQESISSIQEHDSDERFLNMGIDLYKGKGTFTSKNTFMIKDTEIYGKRIVIATGSRPFVPQIEGLEESGYWTNESLFQQETLPKELLVLGGGAIGLELAQAMARLGSKVTVVEKQDSLLGTEDASIQKAAVEMLESEITFHLNAEVKKVRVQNDKKVVTVDQHGQQKEIVVDEILVAVGRIPNSDTLQLDKIGIKMDKKGYILTNEKLQTNESNIYAIGDANGKFPFTHVAGEEGKTVVQNAVLGFPKKMKYDRIPWIIYTDPEIFHIGLTEQEAKEKGISTSIYEVPLSEVDRFVADHENKGLVKILTNSKGKIIGAHGFGKGAGDWMQLVVFAITQNHKIGDLSQMIYPYPNHTAAIQRTSDLYWREKLFSGFLPKLSKKYVQWFR